MDKISKLLNLLTLKERVLVKDILNKLLNSNLVGLDIEKLKGREDIFRIRKGDLRIIYRSYNNQIFILAIDRRNEKTYK
jgi:mRNA-degrading endonuclease RelE of RelBE toxin-antitoxin system